MELEGYHLLDESTAQWPTVQGGKIFDKSTRSTVFTTHGISEWGDGRPDC